jgi:phosphohistidine phosphatase
MATLELYLIRHGLAAQRGDQYPDDSKRPLTSQGMARLKTEAKGLDALGVTFAQIVTSPLVRTRQTAEVLAESMKTKAPIANSDSLAPAGTPGAVMQELAKYAKKGSVALVGHEPNMGELAARLIGARAPLDFKKGAVCRIDFDVLPPKGAGHLRWFITPKILRRLGKPA